jgi:hypothetical protein
MGEMARCHRRRIRDVRQELSLVESKLEAALDGRVAEIKARKCQAAADAIHEIMMMARVLEPEDQDQALRVRGILYGAAEKWAGEAFRLLAMAGNQTYLCALGGAIGATQFPTPENPAPAKTP